MAKLKPNQFLIDGHIITEIPLLFQTEMVQAVAEDRKSQTRRTRGLEDVKDSKYGYYQLRKISTNYAGIDSVAVGFTYFPNEKNIPASPFAIPCPYGKPGDLLWVRETFLILEPEHCKGFEDRFLYKASFDPESDELRREYMEIGYPYQWKPSIHMPKAACRIWLMVEEIRVERLQEITEEDAIAEGVRRFESNSRFFMSGYIDYNSKDVFVPVYHSSIPSFESLWKSINGADSWNQNPWVWVVKFRVLSKAGRPSDEVILENWKEVANG